MAKLRYLGVPIFMNGQNYYIPSLSTRDFIANYAALTKVFPSDAPFTEVYEHYAPIILMAAQRNYPELSADNLAEMFDLYTFRLAIRAVQAASGLEPVSEGE